MTDTGTRVPTIPGPVTGGRRNRPWYGAMVDPASRGYVLEELFVEGEAARYEPAPGTTLGRDGKWELQVAGTARFRTRIVVVRPSDPAAFNGTVVVHWNNVSAGIELGSADGDENYRGCAWVGVSAQKVGIDGFEGDSPYAQAAALLPLGALKKWEPDRYGSLVHPGDAYSFDIFTQVARAVGPGRSTEGIDPMGGLRVERLLATGGSQSAIRLQSYVNGVHPLERTFDGYLLTVPFGIGAAFEDAGPGQPMGAMIPCQVRDDLDVPVLLLASETEAGPIFPTRQPDTDRFVHWEVAGAPHAYNPVAPPPPQEDGRIQNTLSYLPVAQAAQRHMLAWMQGGPPPPSQPRIEFAGSPPAIVRDRFGNAVGGIRLPEVAAPIAAYSGISSGPGPFGGLAGWARPFAQEELRSLYASRSAYAEAYAAAVDDGVASGVFRPEDAPAMKARGAEVAEQLDL